MKSTKMIFIIYAECIEKSRMFYECFGIIFKKERHGAGPEHYSSIDRDSLFEIYPKSDIGANIQGHAVGIVTAKSNSVIDSLINKGFISISDVTAQKNENRPTTYFDPDGRKVLHFTD